MLLKEDSAGYFWSCIFVFFIAHWNMWNNINHWHKNTQLELFLTLLSCNYNTTISIKTNRSKTWDSSDDVTSADQLKDRLCRNNKARWLIGILPGFAHVPLGWLINTQMCHAYFKVNTFRLQANSKMWWYGTNSNNNDLLNLYLRKV